MNTIKDFDVIIVGGSYSGLAAAMALGRAVRNVLVIDSGQPCNRQTPHSHNFITQDGQAPGAIASEAKQQVEKYDTVTFYDGLATVGKKIESGFEIKTLSGDTFRAKKLIFATGVKDIMPDISGFAECWGISILHCPYCHGYEVRNVRTGILGNGNYGFDFSKLIYNWTKDLTLYTNGTSTLTGEQAEKIRSHNIQVIETTIDGFEHTNGQVKRIVFKDGTKTPVKAIYTKPSFTQHCDIPAQLGCEITDQGYIKVNEFQKTTVHGVFACGDSATPMRSVANAVAQGTLSGAMINREIIDEEF